MSYCVVVPKNNKEHFMEDLQRIEFEDYKKNVAESTRETLRKFLEGETYDEIEVKMVLRG